VVYVAGDTFSYTRLAKVVEHHLGRGVEWTSWDMERLRSEVAVHPEDGMRKYRLSFARSMSIARDKERTFNTTQGLEMSDVPAWREEYGSAERLLLG
jgi:hypothetical protein